MTTDFRNIAEEYIRTYDPTRATPSRIFELSESERDQVGDIAKELAQPTIDGIIAQLQAGRSGPVRVFHGDWVLQEILKPTPTLPGHVKDKLSEPYYRHLRELAMQYRMLIELSDPYLLDEQLDSCVEARLLTQFPEDAN